MQVSILKKRVTFPRTSSVLRQEQVHNTIKDPTRMQSWKLLAVHESASHLLINVSTAHNT